MRSRSLDKVFKPRSIAVVGASEEPGKVGTLALSNLVQGEFPGPIYPVSLRRDSVQGIRAYRSVSELPQPADLAILCTPAETIPPLVAQCGEAGIMGLIILTAGFREIGPPGRALEDSIRSAAHRFPAMRILGPNCLGAIVPGSHLNATFAVGMPAPGRVAFVSQSGALCTAVLDWARDQGLGFSNFISIGNALDVGMADLIDYLAEDPATDAVILYVESIENARAFMSAARACTRSKPIVAYKAGRFAESAHAAASHTGALAGVDSVYEAAFERAGIVRIFDVKDLFDCAQLLACGPRVRRERLAIVTNAGGPGVMACDALLALKGKLATLSAHTIKQLDEVLPHAWSHGNPVDVLGDATPERFARGLEIVLADDEVDAVLAILTPQGMTQPTETARAVTQVANFGKPILASWMGAGLVREGVAVLNRSGIPTAATPNEAVAAFMNLVRYARNREILYETPREVQLDFQPERSQSRAVLEKLFVPGQDTLSETDAKAFLTAYGIPVAQPLTAGSADEAVALAKQITFPVVLKIVSPQITHKTDVGGVELNLADEQQVRAAYERIVESVGRAAPRAQIDGVTVQSMVTRAGGIELILGAKKDPVFGPVIMIGLGGIAAELFQDRALGLPPLNERLAMRMLESLHAWPLIRGYRGRQPLADADRLVEILLRFSQLVADFPEIAELDANPLLVQGSDVVALDARLIVAPHTIENRDHRPYAHLAIRPYPEERTQTACLADGTSITLRPIKPEDEPLWWQLLKSCSPETLRSRFRFMFKLDTHETATRFCFVDYDRELAGVAETQIDGQRRLLGVARLVPDNETGRAEFAVLVGDAWQGRGLGTLLMKYCLDHLDSDRLQSIYGETTRDNTRMIRIFKQHGFQLGPAADPSLLRATRAVDQPHNPSQRQPTGARSPSTP
jgi:acetyltransferase